MFKYACVRNLASIKLWARAKKCKFYVINHAGRAVWIIELPTAELRTIFLLAYSEDVQLWTSDFSS